MIGLTLLIAGPLLLVGLVVGVAVSVFQALTSVQEQTLSLVPKMLAVVLVGLFLLAPALALLRDFCVRVIQELHGFGLS
jgi:flagellar biosynthetic protein FliQ